MKAKKIAFLGLCIACAMILSYVEAILPPILTAVPGIKIGLPNIVIVFLLYRFSIKEAAAVSCIRIVLSSLLFGNLAMMMYSLGGAFLSLLIMCLLKRINFFSSVGVSVAGAVCHNLGQIMVAALVLKTLQIGYYMIVLSITGSIAGVLIGILAAAVLRSLKKVRI